VLEVPVENSLGIFEFLWVERRFWEKAILLGGKKKKV